MSYQERAYFTDEPLAHCAAWAEARRLSRIVEDNLRAFMRLQRSGKYR